MLRRRRDERVVAAGREEAGELGRRPCSYAEDAVKAFPERRRRRQRSLDELDARISPSPFPLLGSLEGTTTRTKSGGKELRVHSACSHISPDSPSSTPTNRKPTRV